MWKEEFLKQCLYTRRYTSRQSIGITEIKSNKKPGKGGH